MNETLDISVVIPLLNEEESLPELTERIHAALTGMGKSYEILFIDDGSTDGSFAVIQQLKTRFSTLRAIRFRKNFGKSAALSEGFKAVRGKYVITMDADLQDDPDELPNLVRKLDEGFELVSGWKKIRHDPITKTIPSRFFNFITRWMSGIPLHDFNCGLKAYRREVTQDVRIYGELHRYIPVLAKREGYLKITEIAVKHHARKYGYSKFGLSRFFRGFLDLVTVLFISRYIKRPLHFFGFIGFFILTAGMGINAYLAVTWFMGVPLANRPLLFLGILLVLMGMQLVSTGLIAEMLTHHFQKDETHSVKETID